MTWYYPNRQDGVRAIRFDGTQYTAQSVAGALDLPVHHIITPNCRPGDTSGELLIPDWSEEPVLIGQYIVIGQDRKILEVLEYIAFADKYSTNGLR